MILFSPYFEKKNGTFFSICEDKAYCFKRVNFPVIKIKWSHFNESLLKWGESICHHIYFMTICDIMWCNIKLHMMSFWLRNFSKCSTSILPLSLYQWHCTLKLILQSVKLTHQTSQNEANLPTWRLLINKLMQQYKNTINVET